MSKFASVKQFFASLISHGSVLVSQNVLGVAVLVVLVEVCALSVVYAAYKNRVLFSELENLRKQSEDMQSVWTQLLLEQSTLTSFQRVVDRAQRELSMKIPDPRSVVVLQRN